MIKKIAAVFLTLFLLPSLAAPVMAASVEDGADAARQLYELGLFQGTGADESGVVDFDLDRAPTRAEGVAILVRLLGKESEAREGSWNTPFSDVEDWAAPYIGFAYHNSLVKGVSETVFGWDEPMDAAQYVTLILRAMGYTDGTDFQWDAPWTLSDPLGFTDGSILEEDFIRSWAAEVAWRAMSALCRDGEPLWRVLVEAGAITAGQAESAGLEDSVGLRLCTTTSTSRAITVDLNSDSRPVIVLGGELYDALDARAVWTVSNPDVVTVKGFRFDPYIPPERFFVQYICHQPGMSVIAVTLPDGRTASCILTVIDSPSDG